MHNWQNAGIVQLFLLDNEVETFLVSRYLGPVYMWVFFFFVLGWLSSRDQFISVSGHFFFAFYKVLSRDKFIPVPRVFSYALG